MKKSVAIVVWLLALAVVLGTPSARVLPGQEVAKLVAADGQEADWFGDEVALDGKTAVIGAPYGDGSAENSGAAYVFVRNAGEWTQQAKLLPADGAPDDHFGTDVALDGDTAIVTAPNQTNANGFYAGAAYVFVRSAGVWEQQAKLLASDGASRDRLGSGVVLDGDTAVVGAYQDDDNGDDSGSAYVFVRSAGVWSQQAKLLASDGTEGDHFGWMGLALDGETAIVGAPGDWAGAGSAYVFVRNTDSWTEQAKLYPDHWSASAVFGQAAALDDETAVIAARQEHGAAMWSGAVYVFTREWSTWTQQAKLLPSDAEYGDTFGSGVGVDGDVVIVGARGAESAYLFTRVQGMWAERSILRASDGPGRDFGCGAALDGNTTVVGARLDDDNGDQAGAAYVFELYPDDGPDVPATGVFGIALLLLTVLGTSVCLIRWRAMR